MLIIIPAKYCGCLTMAYNPEVTNVVVLMYESPFFTLPFLRKCMIGNIPKRAPNTQNP